MIKTHELAVVRACRSVGLSKSAYYETPIDWVSRDRELIEALRSLADSHPRRGFWKYYKMLRRAGRAWNHKRLYRVYCEMKLNHRRRAKQRVPVRDPQPLWVPDRPNVVWSADFMSDALYHGRRFRTFNVLDDHNREAVAIEIDTSLTAPRIIRVFEQLKSWRGLPDVLRVDNGPETMAHEFVDWAKGNGMMIQYIEPGEPNQNAYIERFNRTYRDEVLDLYLFETLEQVREITHRWLIDYNEHRPHDSLGDLTPIEYAETAKSSSSQPSA